MIIHRGIAIKVGHLALCVIHDRVGCGEVHGRVDAVALCLEQRVAVQRVVYHAVVMIDSQ